jgi:hypothetical protein
VIADKQRTTTTSISNKSAEVDVRGEVEFMKKKDWN